MGPVFGLGFPANCIVMVDNRIGGYGSCSLGTVVIMLG